MVFMIKENIYVGLMLDVTTIHQYSQFKIYSVGGHTWVKRFILMRKRF